MALFIYHTNFELNCPVSDIQAAQDYLDCKGESYNMTEILKADIENRGYYGLANAIKEIRWVMDGSYTGHIELITDFELSLQALDMISDWVSGQCSDGLGEGFEQQWFAEEYGYYDEDTDEECYAMASFDWQTNNYTFKFVKTFN